MSDEQDEFPDMSAEAFLNLPEAVDGRQTKVDYDEVIKRLAGKPVPMKMVSQIMLECSSDKQTVYPSEVKRFLENLYKKGYKVVYRNNSGKKWVLISKIKV
jgi:hypothetical protein